MLHAATPLIMSPDSLTLLAIVLATVLVGLTLWTIAEPKQPEAIVVGDLHRLLDRISAGGGNPSEADRAELRRLLDYAHGLGVEASVVRNGDAILARG